jgi:hypothetical protein
MATNANPFVVNIVPLQGIATGIAGSADVSQIPNIQANIANLQSMVDYNTKTISVDNIKSYTNSQNIQVLNNLNLSNASLYSNGNLASGSGTVSTISFATATTITGSASTMTFTNAGQNILEILSTGALQYTSPAGSLSTGVNVDGYLYVSKSAYAQNWYQTSDRNQKTNIMPFSTSLTDILKLEPCTFDWLNSEKEGQPELGFIAQDVKTVWPILTTETNDGLGLAYSRFVPLLLEGLRELHGRVSTLEARLPTF